MEMKPVPKKNNRRPYYDDQPELYQESDRDYVLNNYELCLWALDNYDKIKQVWEDADE